MLSNFAWFVLDVLLAAFLLSADEAAAKVLGTLFALCAIAEAVILAFYAATGLRPPGD